MVKKIRYMLFGVFISSLMITANAINVYNYLGAGSNPNLTMTLSATGVSGWGVGYSIGYSYGGGIPCSGNANNNWSAWDVKDSSGTYYGTITLNTDAACTKVIYNANGCPTNPNSSCYTNNSGNGAALSNIVVNNNFYLGVGSITCPGNDCSGNGGNGGGGNSSGPFPDTPPSTPPANFKLTVSGNQILANGQPIRIKGIVRPSLEWSNQGQYLSPDDIKNLANFANNGQGTPGPTNAIRIDLNATYWNNSADSTVKGSYKQIIDAIMYYAIQNNMVVILDYHWFNSTVQQQNMAPKVVDTINFWGTVSSKYKTYGNVIFELYNEPHSLPYNTWLNGDSNWYGMQDLYNTVRATGAYNPVIVNGLDWGYYLGFLGKGVNNCGNTDCLVKDSSQSNGYAYNIIYGSHPYSTGNGQYKGQVGYTYYPADGGPGVPADFNSNFAGIAQSYPIIFTEFGDNQGSDYSNGSYTSIVSAILNEANTNNIHYTGFAWWIDPNEPYFPTLICGNWSNPSPCLSGLLIYNDMQKYPATALKVN